LGFNDAEHCLPLLDALALKEDKETVNLFKDKTVGGSVSMTSFEISL
jgi:4,5-DOPA dioxygenase extradiol